ncbi:MAG TPA: thiamine pyrophosphate-dependent enzyme [Symbiobacteriaceae bacterium]|jgi:TPP-dependent pyruvate/acetoin dehydrogenase alpha subunit
MVGIRSFELKLYELSKRGLLRGSIHFCIGQEATAAGVMAALRPTDYIASTHRGHGHAIAKGFQFSGMYAELLGKSTGYSKGKGGSMHIADLELGHLGANGIVGGGMPIAVGAALGFVQLGQPHVAIAFFGDGAANEGTFHESLNLAALWKLPVVYVCENNQFGMTTPLAEAAAEPDLSKRAAGYGIPGVKADGMDVRAVKAAAAKAVERARSGGGPTLLVLDTYRYEGHYIGDPLVYRTKELTEEWKQKDAIRREGAYLIEHGLATQADLEGIQAEVDREIEEAVAFAINSPEPDDAELFTDVYAE